jgi:hypothetical protein
MFAKIAPYRSTGPDPKGKKAAADRRKATAAMAAATARAGSSTNATYAPKPPLQK